MCIRDRNPISDQSGISRAILLWGVSGSSSKPSAGARTVTGGGPPARNIAPMRSVVERARERPSVSARHCASRSLRTKARRILCVTSNLNAVFYMEDAAIEIYVQSVSQIRKVHFSVTEDHTTT